MKRSLQHSEQIVQVERLSKNLAPFILQVRRPLAQRRDIGGTDDDGRRGDGRIEPEHLKHLPAGGRVLHANIQNDRVGRQLTYELVGAASLFEQMNLVALLGEQLAQQLQEDCIVIDNGNSRGYIDLLPRRATPSGHLYPYPWQQHHKPLNYP